MKFYKAINNTQNSHALITVIVICFLLISCTENQKISTFESIKPQTIGIDFKHNNNHKNKYRFPEIMGSGLAVLDFDLDGDLDLYFVQNTKNKSDQLYQNLYMETGSLNFRNMTSNLGINQLTNGLGISIGDFNNDGYPDIYLTNVNSNVLLKNINGEKFIDVTKTIGLKAYNEMSVSSGFVDLNHDGWLDLVVLNNIDFDPINEPKCKMFQGDDYCPPSSYKHLKNRIFLNNKGKFIELDKSTTGVIKSLPSLALTAFDANDDGLIDLYVANDEKENTLWINQGNLNFKNNAIEMGVAVNGLAKVEASMGIAIGDINNNSQLDLFLTHMWKESNTLYRNDHYNYFTDATNEFKLANNSMNSTGWGTSFLDFENDGDLDLVIANGSILRQDINEYNKGYNEYNHFYAQENNKYSLLENKHAASFPSFMNSRGLIRADFDNDGDSDIVITNINNPPEIYINNSNKISHNNWVGFQATSEQNLTTENTEISLIYNDIKSRHIQTRLGSYASSSDPRILQGLGDFKGYIEVIVRWNKNEFEKFINLQPNQYNYLSKGTGVLINTWNINNSAHKNSQLDKIIDFQELINSINKNTHPNIVKKHLLSLTSNKEELCISLQSYEMYKLASTCYKLLFDVQKGDEDNISSETYYFASINEVNIYENITALEYLDRAQGGINEWYYCYRKAQINYLNDHFKIATEVNNQCSDDNNSIHSIKLAADILKAQGKYKQSFDKYRTILIMEPDKNDIYNDLAEVLNEIQTKDASTEKMKNLAKSNAGYNKLKLVDPILNKLSTYNKNPNYHLDMGLLFNQTKDFKSALFALKRAYDLSPNSEEIYINYAQLLTKNNSHRNAINLLLSKQNSFKNPNSFVLLGSLLFKDNRLNASQNMYLKGQKLFPSNINLLTNLANNYLRLKKLNLAEKYYKKILGIDKENSNAKKGLNEITRLKVKN